MATTKTPEISFADRLYSSKGKGQSSPPVTRKVVKQESQRVTTVPARGTQAPMTGGNPKGGVK